jgi:hypothetical protein
VTIGYTRDRTGEWQVTEEDTVRRYNRRLAECRTGEWQDRTGDWQVVEREIDRGQNYRVTADKRLVVERTGA